MRKSSYTSSCAAFWIYISIVSVLILSVPVFAIVSWNDYKKTKHEISASPSKSHVIVMPMMVGKGVIPVSVVVTEIDTNPSKSHVIVMPMTAGNGIVPISVVVTEPNTSKTVK